MAIVHHRDSHRNLAWRPIPQPGQTGSPEAGCYRAGEVLRKSTRGNYGKRVSRTTQKTAHRVHRVPYLPQTGHSRSSGGARGCETRALASDRCYTVTKAPIKSLYGGTTGTLRPPKAYLALGRGGGDHCAHPTQPGQAPQTAEAKMYLTLKKIEKRLKKKRSCVVKKPDARLTFGPGAEGTDGAGPVHCNARTTRNCRTANLLSDMARQRKGDDPQAKDKPPQPPHTPPHPQMGCLVWKAGQGAPSFKSSHTSPQTRAPATPAHRCTEGAGGRWIQGPALGDPEIHCV